VYAPTGTSAPKNWTGHFSHQDNGSATGTSGTSGGYWNSNGAIDGFQIDMNSGNIASGVVKIYGRI
jgi:hypothetical protein